MKTTQEGQSLKKRINNSRERPRQKTKATKENTVKPIKAVTKKNPTTSVEVYLNVPNPRIHPSPNRLTNSNSTTVLADIVNLKSPPFLASTLELTDKQSNDDFTVQCTDLAQSHYVKSVLSKCLFALLENREDSVLKKDKSMTFEKSLTQRGHTSQKLVQIGKCLNSTGALMTTSTYEEPLHMSTDSDKFHSTFSDNKELIAHKYNSVSLTMRAFISWKRYCYIHKRKRSMQVVIEQSREASSKNITLSEEIDPNNTKKELEPVASYFVKSEQDALRKPQRNVISRQLYNKHNGQINQDLQHCLNEQKYTPEKQQQQSVTIEQIRFSHASQFTDESYLQILSLPFCYNDRLKLKAFTSLRGYLNLQLTRGVVFRKVNLLQKGFTGLVNKIRLRNQLSDSFKNKKLGKLFAFLRNDIFCEQRIRQLEDKLSKGTIKNSPCEERLATRESALSYLSSQSSLNERIKRKMNLMRARRYFSKLQMFCLESRINNVGGVPEFEKMRLFWKRRVLKVLFNLVTLNNRVQKLRVISLQNKDSQVLRHCLKTWQVSTQLKDFKVKNYNRFVSRYFQPWLRESIRRVHAKRIFNFKRARGINQRTFNSIKQYCRFQQDKKQRVLSLFHLRAKNLQGLAFKQGILVFMRRSRIKKNKNLVAGIYLAQRLFWQSMRKLKAFVDLKLLGKTTRQKHNYLQGVKLLQEWSVVAQHTKKLRKFNHRQETKLKYIFIQKLRQTLVIRQREYANLNVSTLRYQKILKQCAFYCFKQSFQQCQAKQLCCDKLFRRKQFALRQLVFSALDANCQLNQVNKQKVGRMNKGIVQRLKMFVFDAFCEYKILKLKGKQAHQILRQNQLNKQGSIFTFLHLYSIRKINERLCISSLSQIRNQRTCSQVLQSFIEYAKLHKRTSFFQLQAQSKRRFELLSKSMKSMLSWRMNSAKEAGLALMVCSQRRQDIFIQWYKHVHEYVPKLNGCKIHYLKQRFRAFKLYVRQTKKARLQRRKIKDLNAGFVVRSQISQAIYWLYLNCQDKIQQRSKLQLSQKIYKSRLFQKWCTAIPVLRKTSRANLRAEQFQRRSIVYKAMEMLYVYSQIKKNQASIITAFRQKERMRVLSICISVLVDHASENKLRVLSFIQLMEPVIQKSKAEAFGRWIKAHADLLKVDMADRIYMLRNGMEKKQIVIQYLKYRTDKRLAEKRKLAKVRKHCKEYVMRQVLTKLIQIRNRKVFKKLNISKTRINKAQTVKGMVFVALVSHYNKKVNALLVQQRVFLAMRQQILCRCMSILMQNKTLAQKSQLIRSKTGARLIKQKLTEWRLNFKFAHKISRMAQIVQNNNERSLVCQVLPAILRHGKLLTLTNSLNLRRQKRLQRNVFSAFISQLSIKNILQALVDKFHTSKIVKIFKELRRQAQASIVHRELISSQIDLQNQEDQTQILRAVFGELVQRRFNKKANVCARHKFVFSTMRRVLEGFRQVTRKLKTLKCNQTFYEKNNLDQYFSLWMAARELNIREKTAFEVLGFSTKKKVFGALERHKNMMIAFKTFKKVWEVKRLKFLGLRGFWQHCNISKFQAYVLKRIAAKRCQVVQRDALLLFTQGCKESKLERSLKTYQKNHTAKQVMVAWRAETQASNKFRLNIIKLRYGLNQNPRLGRPLLIIRNLFMYKAFTLFKQKTQRLRFLRKQSRLSAYALYLRLIRKAFYGLRLNAADEYQSKKSRQIKRFVIKRRGFESLKLAVQNQKESRSKASHAAIFRFLSLQRKALKSMVICYTQKCRLRVQNNFAMTLYYKHLLTRGFISFQINTIARKQTRRGTLPITIQEGLPEDEYEDPDRQFIDRSQSQRFSEKIKTRVQKENQIPNENSSRNGQKLNVEDFTLAPYSRTFAVSPPNKQLRTPPNQISTISHEYVISLLEMGPIRSIDYQKLQNLPQTMLSDQKRQSMSSSLAIDQVPSCISGRASITTPLTQENFI